MTAIKVVLILSLVIFLGFNIYKFVKQVIEYRRKKSNKDTKENAIVDVASTEDSSKVEK